MRIDLCFNDPDRKNNKKQGKKYEGEYLHGSANSQLHEQYSIRALLSNCVAVGSEATSELSHCLMAKGSLEYY